MHRSMRIMHIFEMVCAKPMKVLTKWMFFQQPVKVDPEFPDQSSI